MRKAKQNEDITGVLKIGEKLRHLRMANGLRMTDLAERVGCSESMISKVEAGKVNPSFHTLSRLITVLQTDVEYLFAVESGISETVGRAGKRPVIDYDPIGGITKVKKERLIPYSAEHLLQANIHIVSPGGGHPKPIRHPGEEMGYILEGRLELIIEGEKHKLAAGDSFHFRSERPHSYRNPGRTITRVLWVNTPPSFYVRPDHDA